MSRVFHGRMDLHWCLKCKAPLIAGGSCPKCRSGSIKVKYTPPGDIRPAFLHDIEEVLKLSDDQWGTGAGAHLLGDPGPVVLNPCPAPDRLDEVIVGGEVIGAASYTNIKRSTSFLLKKEGGRRLRRNGFKPSKAYVITDPSVVVFLLDGKNLLCPGILDADPNIKIGDEVLVLTPEGCIVGSGTARKMGDGMVETRGMGVKIRWALDPIDDIPPLKSIDEIKWKDRNVWTEIWKHVVDVNNVHLRSKIKRSIGFLRKLAETEDLPIAVSFSGGKDSLATLYLALDAGLRPPIMFIDTGLEFPETIDHVYEIAKDLDLKLLKGEPISGFFENVGRFGPPGRDFRWCCKLCKLGPTSRTIAENFPDGVLTLIGQRRFKSDKREKKGALWTNPWVPLQKGASPVQDWTALDIWLYIFLKDAPYNPLYESGFQRIGCWLCPSSDMAEMELIQKTRVDTSEWDRFLSSESEDGGHSQEWIDHGYHRFKNVPPHMKRLANDMGIDLSDIMGNRDRRTTGPVIELVEGWNTCDDGISREGIIGSGIPWDDLVELLNIIGSLEKDEDSGGVSLSPNQWKMKRKALEIFPDGTLVIRGTDHKDLKDRTRQLRSVIQRATGCIGCSICVGRCKQGALSIDMDRNKIRLDSESCIHCSECLGPCPAETFLEDPFNL